MSSPPPDPAKLLRDKLEKQNRLKREEDLLRVEEKRKEHKAEEGLQLERDHAAILRGEQEERELSLIHI